MENITTNALKELQALNEDVFTFDTKGIEDLEKFLNGDMQKDVEIIIDPEATTVEDLKDSYEGKVVLCCDVCKSLIYKDRDDICMDEESEEVNKDEECPFCQSLDGFKIVGVIAPYKDEEKSLEDEEDEEDIKVDEVIEESYKDHKRKVAKNQLIQEAEKLANKRCFLKHKKVNEDFKKISVENGDSITTTEVDDSGKVTVTTDKKEKVEDIGETIVPVPEEIKQEIEVKQEVDKEEEIPAEDVVDQEVDIDIDEIDEEDFDQLGESYLRRVYENVKSFKTTKGSLNGNNLMLEGVITFKSGKKAKTNFMFESKYQTAAGKLKFFGENVQLSNCKKAYTLTGSVDGKKLMLESLTYNYNAKDVNSNKSQRFCGTVKNARAKKSK